jgi:hypothetical protein
VAVAAGSSGANTATYARARRGRSSVAIASCAMPRL